MKGSFEKLKALVRKWTKETRAGTMLWTPVGLTQATADVGLVKVNFRWEMGINWVKFSLWLSRSVGSTFANSNPVELAGLGMEDLYLAIENQFQEWYLALWSKDMKGRDTAGMKEQVTSSFFRAMEDLQKDKLEK